MAAWRKRGGAATPKESASLGLRAARAASGEAGGSGGRQQWLLGRGGGGERRRQARKGSVSLQRGSPFPAAVKCQRATAREMAMKKLELAPEMIEKIQEMTSSGLAPLQTRRLLSQEKAGAFASRQACCRRPELMPKKCKRRQGSKASARMLLQERESLRELRCREEGGFSLGFLARKGEELARRASAQEACVDSALKAGSPSLELFVAMGAALGAGFPMAYLLLEGPKKRSSEERREARQDAMKRFMRALCDAPPSFRPRCFFPGKGQGQINSMHEALKALARLCCWRMKRAAIKRARLAKKDDSECIAKERESSLLFYYAHASQQPSTILRQAEEATSHCGKSADC